MREAIAGIPEGLRNHLENVEVLIADWPTEDELESAEVPPGYTLFGLYSGVPLTERTSGYHMVLPDRITIFQGPLEEAYRESRRPPRRDPLHRHPRVRPPLRPQRRRPSTVGGCLSGRRDAALSGLRHLTSAWDASRLACPRCDGLLDAAVDLPKLTHDIQPLIDDGAPGVWRYRTGVGAARATRPSCHSARDERRWWSLQPGAVATE